MPGWKSDLLLNASLDGMRFVRNQSPPPQLATDSKQKLITPTARVRGPEHRQLQKHCVLSIILAGPSDSVPGPGPRAPFNNPRPLITGGGLLKGGTLEVEISGHFVRELC